MAQQGNIHSLHSNRSDSPHPECRVDASRKLVVVKFGKKLTFRDVEHYTEQLRASPLFQRDFSEIADLSGVEELNLEAEDLLKLADQRDPFSRNARRAFVAQTPEQTHAARLHEMLRGQRNFEIFATFEEAESWVER